MRTKIEVDGVFWILLAMSVILIPIKWIFAWVIAAVIHELCHLLATMCFRCPVDKIKICAAGTKIQTGPLTAFAGFICEAAGPIGSLLLLLLAKWMPTMAICGFFQGVFNLLPFYPLDGRRIIERITVGCLPAAYAIKAAVVIQYTVAIVIFLGAFWLLYMGCGPFPLLIVMLLIWNDRKNTLQKRG